VRNDQRMESTVMTRPTPRLPVEHEAPVGARHLATLDLAAPGGARWVERFWLLRDAGLDSLWTARPDGIAHAELAVAADSRGAWNEAGARLLTGYLAGRRARIRTTRRAGG
jgi:hypothetical protein